MADLQSWDPRRRLRHLKQIAINLLPAFNDDMVTLALFSDQRGASSHPPVLLHISTTAADTSPVFSDIEWGSETCAAASQQPWEASSFRLVLLSHPNRAPDNPQALDSEAAAGRVQEERCHVCMQYTSHLRSSAADCVYTGTCCCDQEPILRVLPIEWRCKAHNRALPVGMAQGAVQEESTSCKNDMACQGGRTRVDDKTQKSLAMQLSSSGLATIRESMCLSDKQLPSPPPESIHAVSRRHSSTESGPLQVFVVFDIERDHVGLSLLTHEGQLQSGSVQANGNHDPSEACETWKWQASDSAGPDAPHPMPDSQESGAKDTVQVSACEWVLQSRNASHAAVLLDTVVDLQADVTPVPLAFSRGHTFSALPASCLILGVSSGTAAEFADQHHSISRLLQQQVMLLHPKLEGQSLKKFISDNSSSKQEWPNARGLAAQGFTAGLMDTIVNALIPFPVPASRPKLVNLPRIMSTPAVRNAAAAAQSSTPASPRGTQSTTARHERHRSYDAARPTCHCTSLHEAGLATSNPPALMQHRRMSAALSTSSASTAGSDPRSTVFSRNNPTALVSGGSQSMPAMQYVAFVVPKVAEMVATNRRAAAHAAEVREHVTVVVKTCRATLELEARVKRLQVKTQQLRLKNDDLARRAVVAHRTAAARKQRVLDRQEKLQQACGSGGPLAAGLQRAKDQRLCYPDLLHTWRHTHGLLVTRRHQLVISLFHHFKLGPQAVVRYAGGVLTEMQDLWMHQKLLQHPNRRPTHSMSTVAAAPGQRRSLSAASSQLSAGLPCSRPGEHTPVTEAGHDLHTHCEDGLLSRLTPVMTIMGLQCAPDAARRAQLGELGWETSSALHLDHMNAAYGYITQVVTFLGNLLDVAPLYPMEVQGSYCSVQQYVPRMPRQGVADPDLHEEEHGLGLRLTEQPLYVDQGKHDKLKKFAWGCFLLGANVQQLLHEHGIIPHGQQFLLENLEKLVSAARMSGLQPGL